jgi:hypothetical protein
MLQRFALLWAVGAMAIVVGLLMIGLGFRLKGLGVASQLDEPDALPSAAAPPATKPERGGDADHR